MKLDRSNKDSAQQWSLSASCAPLPPTLMLPRACHTTYHLPGHQCTAAPDIQIGAASNGNTPDLLRAQIGGNVRATAVPALSVAACQTEPGCMNIHDHRASGMRAHGTRGFCALPFRSGDRSRGWTGGGEFAGRGRWRAAGGRRYEQACRELLGALNWRTAILAGAGISPGLGASCSVRQEPSRCHLLNR